MTRRTRFAAALVAIAALLLGPLAMAANACPHVNAMAAMASMHAVGGMPCHEDPATPTGPNFCDTEKAGVSASFEAARPVTPAPVAILELRPAAALHAASMRAAARGYEPPGPAPPLVRFTVLRI